MVSLNRNHRVTRRQRIVHLMCALALVRLGTDRPAEAASETKSSAGSCVDAADTGTVAWQTAANAHASDNVFATAAPTLRRPVSHYLTSTGFGFSIIPAGATSQGIHFGWEKKSDANHTVDNACPSPQCHPR